LIAVASNFTVDDALYLSVDELRLNYADVRFSIVSVGLQYSIK